MDEQIKLYLFKSVKTLNQNFILVVVLSLTSIFILPHWGTFLLGLAGIIITPVIYGRFFEIPWRTNYSTYPQLFNQHWLNYFVVTIILKIPYLAFGRLLSGDSGYLFAPFLEALTLVIGIYVIPLVFITKAKIFPVAFGLRCLWQNFPFSLPLVFLTLLIIIISRLSQVFVLSSFQDNHAALFAIAFIHNILLNYIALSVFMTSTMLLLNKPDLKKYLQPAT